MKAKLLNLIGWAFCVTVGVVIGKICGQRETSSTVNTDYPLAPRVSRVDIPPDLVVVGRVTGIGDDDESSFAWYRVEVVRVLRGKLADESIKVFLPSLFESPDAWYPQKMPIKKDKFEGVFVLNRTSTSAYCPRRIFPEDAFTWPPDPGLLEFLADCYKDY